MALPVEPEQHIRMAPRESSKSQFDLSFEVRHLAKRRRIVSLSGFLSVNPTPIWVALARTSEITGFQGGPARSTRSSASAAIT